MTEPTDVGPSTADQLFRLIRSFGYTTHGQTAEIVDAIVAKWGTPPQISESDTDYWVRNAANETKAEVLRQASRMLLIGEQENRALRAEVQALQNALNFWLPCVPGVHSERDERIASDAGLLAGFDGDIEETAEARGWIALTANA